MFKLFKKDTKEEYVGRDFPSDVLPLGSIVELKKGNKLMICGRFSFKFENNTNNTFDYVGYSYPTGLISDEEAEPHFFNQDEISEVIFRGYSDEEDKKFVDSMKDLAEDMGYKVHSKGYTEL